MPLASSEASPGKTAGANADSLTFWSALALAFAGGMIKRGLDFNKNIVQGKGLRVASRVARSGRRVITTSDGGGDFTVAWVQLVNAIVSAPTCATLAVPSSKRPPGARNSGTFAEPFTIGPLPSNQMWLERVPAPPFVTIAKIG